MAKTDNAGEVAALSDKGEGEIVLSCGDGCISVTGVVPEGKKPMKSADYIRGRRYFCGRYFKYTDRRVGLTPGYHDGIDYSDTVFVPPALILALWAQFNVKTTFAKYSPASAPTKE